MTSLDEFGIIEQYFNRNTIFRDDVVLGIGDDAALVEVRENQQLVLTIDTLVEGVHFPKNAPPFDIGYKSLAVNLSDLAAMGATPTFATLALTLPDFSKEWLQAFCDGFFSLLTHYKMQLIGGNLSKGPLTISCQAHGLVEKNHALLRSHAKSGDLIYITGQLGDAALAVQCLKNEIKLTKKEEEEVFKKYYHPIPRVEVGLAIVDLANAAIDISDGLIADLSHILESSQKGAIINTDTIPLSPRMKRDTLLTEKALEMTFASGDDYELCFTIPEQNKLALHKQAQCFNVDITCIGKITEEKELIFINQAGTVILPVSKGYRHFS